MHILKGHVVNSHSLAATDVIGVCTSCLYEEHQRSLQVISIHFRKKILSAEDFPHLRYHKRTRITINSFQVFSLLLQATTDRAYFWLSLPLSKVKCQEHLKILSTCLKGLLVTKVSPKKESLIIKMSGRHFLIKLAELDECLNYVPWHCLFPSK